jgi:hypothetical protein
MLPLTFLLVCFLFMFTSLRVAGRTAVRACASVCVSALRRCGGSERTVGSRLVPTDRSIGVPVTNTQTPIDNSHTSLSLSPSSTAAASTSTIGSQGGNGRGTTNRNRR